MTTANNVLEHDMSHMSKVFRRLERLRLVSVAMDIHVKSQMCECLVSHVHSTMNQIWLYEYVMMYSHILYTFNVINE